MKDHRCCSTSFQNWEQWQTIIFFSPAFTYFLPSLLGKMLAVATELVEEIPSIWRLWIIYNFKWVFKRKINYYVWVPIRIKLSHIQNINAKFWRRYSILWNLAFTLANLDNSEFGSAALSTLLKRLKFSRKDSCKRTK